MEEGETVCMGLKFDQKNVHIHVQCTSRRGSWQSRLRLSCEQA